MRIESSKSGQVKHVAALQKKARYRREQRAFVVEGLKMVLEAPADRILSVYGSDSFLEQGGRERLGNLSCTAVSDNAFKAMSDTQTPQGVLAVIKAMEWEKKDFCKSGGKDIYNPKVVRSTMGSIYRVPFAVCEDLEEILRQCRDAGITSYGAHLAGEKNYEQADYKRPCAFLIGNEAVGLTEKISGAADFLIKIPMEGSLESLNAAVAASILAFEAARQRRI